MESLIKQTRSKFSGKKEERSSSSTDRKIPPQKTQSFSKEKKRSESWIKRQFSRQMSWEYDFSSSEYPTAVAAAAYAIQSLEESKSWERKETSYGPDKSLSKMKSKVDDKEKKLEPLKSALRSSDETSRASFKDADGSSTSKRMPEGEPSMKKKISFADHIDENGSSKAEKLPEKATSLKRPPTSADKPLNIAEIGQPETILPKLDRPPSRRQSTSQPVETKRPVTKPGPGDSAADAWEKEQMASIQDRYEKLKATIDNWETKKMKKAKRKIEKTQAELDKRRVKAMQKYHNEIARIDGIAKGAKAQAEENRRNEELKVKEKANKIRATGKIPPACLCF